MSMSARNGTASAGETWLSKRCVSVATLPSMLRTFQASHDIVALVAISGLCAGPNLPRPRCNLYSPMSNHRSAQLTTLRGMTCIPHVDIEVPCDGKGVA